MQKNKVILSILLLLIATNIVAQNTVKLSGSVVDSNQEPLISVSVFLKNTNTGKLTDENGHFALSVPKGKHTLVAQSMGYTTKEIEVIVTDGKSKKINIQLDDNSSLLGEIAIEGKSPVQQLRETPYNVTAVEAKKLHNLSVDMNQVLNRTTGIRVRESGGMGSGFSFSLNGFSGNQVKFFLDGVPIDNYGSSFTLNNIPINIAERIEVYKGVVPITLGGDALGGAVNIVTQKNKRSYIDASYSFGSFNTHKASVSARFVDEKGFVVNMNTFGNYSDNDYKVDVEIVDKTETGKYLPSRKYKRFHDGYKSASMILEAGVQGKSYADYLLVGMTVTGNKNEIQQGSTMQSVVGNAYTNSKGFIPSMKYKKSNLFVEGLDFDVFGSYNISKNNSVDTCSRVYDWNGKYTFRSYDGENKMGELGEKQHYVYDQRNLVTTANLSYRLSKHHSFATNYTYSGYKREEDDKFKEIMRPGSPSIYKNILGASYNLTAVDNKLNFSVFGKMYDLHTKMSKDSLMLSSNSNDWGYGTAVAYHIFPWLQGKVSYEYAYRLPSELEMLGDGLSVLSNVGLKSEKSNNLNLGLVFTKDLNRMHYLNIEGNFVYRNAKDFIRSKVVGPNNIYENMSKIKVVGLDGVVRYAYSDWLQFETNATWQKTTDINKIIPDSEMKNDLYGEQMPNMPIFYTNADLSFLLRNLFKKEDNLTLSVGANYIASFYLDWPVLGEKEYKKSIPEQFTQNASVTYSLSKNKYNISFECQNITDKKVYDYYKVQRPGRSFNVKLRYLFNK